ncbi:hypothetical protein [Streptosporangium canum]|uniref:hypothetical protein n=1 Tax=Streptosporangium canum TaxID=324952 RepID=UPI00378E0C96
MITYRATLDVSRDLVHHVATLLAAERRRRGTRADTRAPTCFGQAVLVLRRFRDRTDPTDRCREKTTSVKGGGTHELIQTPAGRLDPYGGQRQPPDHLLASQLEDHKTTTLCHGSATLSQRS